MVEVNCNLCGANDWRERFPATTLESDKPDASVFRCTSPDYGRHARIVQCRRCGLVYANPRWSEDELVAAYTAVEDETYVAEREGREITFEQHLQELESFTGPAEGRSLLDVGAYIGVFVETALAAGWQAEGIEPSRWAVDRARELGLPVHQGTQQAAALNGRTFDVITMWDVIEHLTDPAAEIEQAHRLLKPGGWLALHTMDIDSPIARLMGGRWPWLMDMHLYYFSQKTLADMLQRNGFEVVWSGTQGRYLRLGYLAGRLGGFSPVLRQAATSAVDRLQLAEKPVPINLGDLFTVYARKAG